MWKILRGSDAVPTNRLRARIEVATLVGFCLAGPGSVGLGAQPRPDLPQRASWLASFGEAAPTPAARRFCRRHPVECRVDVSQAETLELTEATWRTITAVNRHVNASVSAVTDEQHWGVADRWDYPADGRGDCEDIQLLKRKLLVDKGLPRRAMRMAMVLNDEGEGHAVLVIRTDRGDFILDNSRNEVLGWELTRYTFVKREGSAPFVWVGLNDQRGQTVVANRQ
jgi:predicted transglutaminase-like cysteine proteinase